MISNFLFLTVSLLLLGFFYGVFVFLLKRDAGKWETVKEAVKLTSDYLLIALVVIFLAGTVLNSFGKALFLAFEVGAGIYFWGLFKGFFQERVIYNAVFEVKGTELFLIDDYGEKELSNNPILLDILKQRIKQLITEEKISPDVVVFTDKFAFYPLKREESLKFYVKDYNDCNDEISYKTIYETKLSF